MLVFLTDEQAAIVRRIVAVALAEVQASTDMPIYRARVSNQLKDVLDALAVR